MTGSGDGIFTEPASHDGKAAEWRPVAVIVDTAPACAAQQAGARPSKTWTKEEVLGGQERLAGSKEAPGANVDK